jgi:DNA-binding NarL/FixJ family response regulator
VQAPIRVVMAEDNLLVREGIRRIVDAAPDLRLVASCSGLDELLDRATGLRPDIVLTDIRMPPRFQDEGIQAAALLRQSSPSLAVLVLRQYDEPDYALRLLELGSERRGYLLKDRLGEPAELVAALRRVAAGGSVIDPQIVATLVAATRRRPESILAGLTPRERDVLARMAEGRNNDAIAAACGLTLGSVEKHINTLFSKLGLAEEREVHRRVKAVLIYLADEANR